MLDLVGLLPLFPLLGFLILVLSFGRLPKLAVAIVGAGSVGLSFLLAAGISITLLTSNMESFSRLIWTWMSVGDFTSGFSFYLDGLAVVMILVITGVGFLIHLYSTGFMIDDPGYAKFFAYMNLFVAAMLVLVLADNLVLLYLGWEGVGLCSYLLIGFWYENPANGYAARKAFVVTRVGDTSMAVGLFLLFTQLGTLNIQDMLLGAEQQWVTGQGVAVVAALLLLGGAVGKSAQLPLQTWLPDAMAGPTPISALIHAATMVTAGVYLIARTHVLFELAPLAQNLVAWVGLITLLMAGFTALTQFDIKRILAYSTISQIGYMFLGLGVGAWSASIFHLMTHAFFKALLFLAAGTVILSLHHEHNIFKMGGMWRQLPVAFASFIIGSAALAALPFTAGYFSKDEILLAALAVEGGTLLWLGGVLGAFLTALYSFRLVFIAFLGKPSHATREVTGFTMAFPLAVLAFLSLAGGLIHVPVEQVFGLSEEHHAGFLVHAFMIAVPILGVAAAWLFFLARPQWAESMKASTVGGALHRFWFSGWGMDALYQIVFVRPFVFLANLNRHDFFDTLYAGIAALTRGGHKMVAQAQTGQLRWYAVSIAIGLVLMISLGVAL
ncbi:MAG: NADH-quinone oxidoreductase subunit L [Pseudohongiellaceae bacterium]